jgi:hypothetical protein
MGTGLRSPVEVGVGSTKDEFMLWIFCFETSSQVAKCAKPRKNARRTSRMVILGDRLADGNGYFSPERTQAPPMIVAQS